MKKHAKHEGMISDRYVLQKFASLVAVVTKKNNETKCDKSPWFASNGTKVSDLNIPLRDS